MVATALGSGCRQKGWHKSVRALIFGQTGQVASELARAIPEGWHVRFLGREDADLAKPEQCREHIRHLEPDIIINAAAYTAVDQAEQEEDLAHIINAEAPAAMAHVASEIGAAFLHISTDYVFDGSGDAPFLPDDPTRPLGAYGRSKLAGEQAIMQSSARWLILRTSWVFSAHGNNFVRTMLRLGAEREALSVVADQFGGPTPASAIAQCLIDCGTHMHSGHPGGLHHFTGQPIANWACFAEAIMTEAKLECRIDPINTSGYPTPAQRPANSRMDCASLHREFGIDAPDWRTELPIVIKELLP